MLIPVLTGDSFTGYLIAFAFLGIGNTLLQVGMNPLVTEVVNADKLTGTITLGQFVKAICSFLAPIIAAACAGTAFGWKLLFPIYAAITLLATLWLWLSPVKSEPVKDAGSVSFARTFALLKDKTILLFFIAILVLVGVDVGIGVTFPKLLMERCGFDVADAGLGKFLPGEHRRCPAGLCRHAGGPYPVAGRGQCGCLRPGLRQPLQHCFLAGTEARARSRE